VQKLLKPALCPTHMPLQDRADSIVRLARLVESAALLNRVHTALTSPTNEGTFNRDECILTTQTLLSFQTIVSEEIGMGIPLYASGLVLCYT
jgi:hypothetical protein